MTGSTLSSRVAWTDRWTKPPLERLTGALKAQHRRQFLHLMNELENLGGLERTIIWYGPSWKWTIAYNRLNRGGAARARSRQPSSDERDPETFCYLVPSVETPVVCIPLAEAEAQRILQQGAPRYIREAMLAAKCAVQIRWATWSPATEAETRHLVELLRRKHTLRDTPRQANPQDN